MREIKIGSLFDGIGAFPYAASLFGVKTIWASEILPHAVSVTRRHFPDMTHVGDITKLSGDLLPPVDVIVFGSPCQDLSQAAGGNRAGLAGERSGLFMEAIRIINEMRCATNGKYPRYAIWENVIGCFSSNGRRDYKAVLEAFTQTDIPMPESGRWANAGLVRSDRAHVAWVVYDACRGFGLAQRRKRVFTLCDFGKGCPEEILLVPKSLRWYPPQSFGTGEGAAAAVESGAGGTECRVYGICSLASNSMKSSNPHSGVYEADSARTLDLNCGNPGCNQGGMAVVAFNGGASPQAGSIACSEKVSPTLKSASSGLRTPCICEPKTVILNDQGGDSLNVEKNVQAPTLRANTHGNLPIVCTGDELPAVTMRVRCGCAGGGKGALLQTEKSGTLATDNDQTLFCAATTQANAEIIEDLCPTITAAAGNSGDNKPYIAYGFDLQQITSKTNRSGLKEVQPSLCAAGNPHVVHPEIAGTLCASGAGLSRPAGMASETDLAVAYCLQGNMIGREDKNGPAGSGVNKEVCFSLNTADRPAVVFNRQRSDMFRKQDIASTQSARQHKDATDLICEACAVDCRNFKELDEVSGTLQAKTTPGYSLNYQNPVRNGYVVRRLTPTECERLMGFPDDFTAYGHDGKPISDSKRYQMLGNSIATSCAAYIIQGILEQYEKEAENWK